MSKYDRIMTFVTKTPWAILPQKLIAIRELIAIRASGNTLTDEEIKERLDASQTRIEATGGNGRFHAVGQIAVIPVLGSIVPRANLFSDVSGAASIQRLTSAFRSAVAEPDIAHIVFDFDSPGGAVDGVPELAAEIYKARGTKPITAVANTIAASAAYWLATSADELIVTPSGEVGSVGVFAAHQDMSQYLEREGVKITLVSAGKFKVETNPYEPLTEEARAHIQSRVDDYYKMFTTDVARNRGVKRTDVVNGFGEGRMVGAKQAVAMGMADRVATFDETIQRIQKSGKRGRSASADLEFRRRRLRTAALGSVETKH